jgi:hypothetical protein
VTVVLLWALLRMLDLVALRNLFLDLPVWFYFLPLAVILGGQVAYAWRWRLLLRASGVSVPFTVVIRQYFVGIFVNNFLPSTVGGDAAKVIFLGRDHRYARLPRQLRPTVPSRSPDPVQLIAVDVELE